MNDCEQQCAKRKIERRRMNNNQTSKRISEGTAVYASCMQHGPWCMNVGSMGAVSVSCYAYGISHSISARQISFQTQGQLT
eukprot:6173007-Pleurochrysis_carterae.AAC.1